MCIRDYRAAIIVVLLTAGGGHLLADDAQLGVKTVPGSTPALAEIPRGDAQRQVHGIQPEALREGTKCQIVMTRHERLWDRYAIWPFYQGTVIEASNEGVLLAASRRSGFGQEQVPPIVQYIPFKYSWPLYLVPRKSIAIGREKYEGAKIWIPVASIKSIERLTAFDDE